MAISLPVGTNSRSNSASQLQGSPRCSLRSPPRRPARSATARGLPGPTAASSGTDRAHRRPYEQGVGLSDHGDPTLFPDGWQRGEFQHPQGLPAELAQRALSPSADRLPRDASTAGEGVDSGRDEEGAGLGNRLAQQFGERVADAVTSALTILLTRILATGWPGHMGLDLDLGPVRENPVVCGAYRPDSP